MADQTTFILGAGLGKEFGFPDGPQLREKILNQLEPHERELRDIVRIGFERTVDEIAAKYEKHRDRLRHIVTHILWEAEDEHKLLNGPNTYKELLRQVAKAEGHQVNIVTFNYDRSLQYLLHRLNCQQPSENHRIRNNIITTVYGRLPPLLPSK